ncbi:MAG: hypothetical protein ACOCX7_02370 [Bacteroidota bacterium]
MPTETISRTVTDGVEDPPVGSSYEWTSGYDISVPEYPEGSDCKVTISIKIKLDPDEGISESDLNSLKQRWATNISSVWSGKFQICLPEGTEPSEGCPCPCFAVEIGVEWATTGQHHTVRVRTGPARSNMSTWDTHDVSEEGSPNVAAHEFGHMMGLKDEYPDPANAPERVAGDTDSIMRDSGSGVAKSSHYGFIRDWVNSKFPDCSYEIR